MRVGPPTRLPWSLGGKTLNLRKAPTMDGISSSAATFAAILILVTLFRLVALEKLIGRLSRVDAKLDALLKNAGIDFDPYDAVPKEVVQAIQRCDKIQAIKHYREATGTGLKEAKEFVEEIQRRAENAT